MDVVSYLRLASGVVNSDRRGSANALADWDVLRDEPIIFMPTLNSLLYLEEVSSRPPLSCFSGSGAAPQL